jgi:hypothetical protein
MEQQREIIEIDDDDEINEIESVRVNQLIMKQKKSSGTTILILTNFILY